MIYLDNAATSFPKPPQVAQKMCQYIDQVGATINRSVYGTAQEAGLITLQLRQRLKRPKKRKKSRQSAGATDVHVFMIFL